MRSTTGVKVVVSLFFCFFLVSTVIMADLIGLVNLGKMFKPNLQPFKYPEIEWVVGWRTPGEGETAFERDLKSVFHFLSFKQEADGKISNTGSTNCRFILGCR